MVDFKLVISTKDGKSMQKVISGAEAMGLVGKKIRDIIKGESINMAGYEFQITGGSDYCGFPMRRDVPGTGRKKILAVSGVGVRKKAKGIRQRKTVCGNTIHPRISQINLKVLKEGKASLAPKKEGAEETEETPKEEKKEKKAKKKEKKPKEEKQPEKETKEEKAEESK